MSRDIVARHPCRWSGPVYANGHPVLSQRPAELRPDALLQPERRGESIVEALC